MWSAKKQNVVKMNGELQVVIEFSNGVESFTENVRARYVDDTYISDYVGRRIEELTKIDKVANDLKSVVDIAPTVKSQPEVKPEPTVDDIKISTYFTHLNRYKKLLTALNLGLITDKNADLLDEKKYCIDNFTADLIDSMMF